MRTYKKTTIGAAILLLLFLASYLYPLYGPMDFNKEILVSDEKGNIIGRAPFPPSSEHILGTDRNGQDIHLLLLYGAKYTLVTAMIVALLRVLFGGIMGVFLSLYAPVLKKYFKDFFIVFRYIPTTFLGIVLMLQVFGKYDSPYSSVITYQIIMLVFLGFPSVTVFATEITDELIRSSFVRSSYLMGASKFHVFRTHLIPYFRSYGVLFTFQQLLSTLQIIMHLGIFGFYLGGETIGGTFGYEKPPKAASLTNEWAGLIGQNFYDFMRAPWMIFAPVLGFLVVIFIVNIMKKELEENLSGILVLKKKRGKKEESVPPLMQPAKESFVFVEKEQSQQTFSPMKTSGKRKKQITTKGLAWVSILIFLSVVIFYKPGGEMKAPKPVSNNKKLAQSRPVLTNTMPVEENAIPSNQKAYAVGEEIKFDDSTLTVTKVEKSKGSPTEKPGPGNEFYIVHLLIKNTSTNQKVRFAPHYFDAIDKKGKSFQQPFLMIDIDTALSSGELEPGTSVTGTVVFEMPMNQSLRLRYVPYQQVKKTLINLQ